MLLPITSGWQNWQTVSGRINLEKGEYTLRMKIINGDFNLNLSSNVLCKNGQLVSDFVSIPEGICKFNASDI